MVVYQTSSSTSQKYRIDKEDVQYGNINVDTTKRVTGVDGRVGITPINDAGTTRPTVNRVKGERPKTAGISGRKGTKTSKTSRTVRKDVISGAFGGRPASAGGVGAKFLMERSR